MGHRGGKSTEQCQENVLASSTGEYLNYKGLLNRYAFKDLLAHQNLKVFVTHGGIGSLSEAIYHKAALVGIPFSNDQKPNLLRAEKHGYAVLLEWDSLNEEDLTAAIKTSIESKDMRDSLEKVHRLILVLCLKLH